jgi:hypothetical protein
MKRMKSRKSGNYEGFTYSYKKKAKTSVSPLFLNKTINSYLEIIYNPIYIMSQQPNNSFSGTVPAGGTLTGVPQVCNGSISIICYLDTPKDLIISVSQSLDGVTFPFIDNFNASVSLYGNKTRTQFYVKTKYFKVTLTNVGLLPATGVILTTLLTSNNHDGTSEQPSVVSADNLITETLATRGVYYLVVGNWYRVASVGITSGAEWNAIGAIVDGESEPVIGRLFKCLSIGPNVGGQGTCYDVEYNTNLITETLATRGVYYLVVGTWYRVASVGITSGAEWNAIGAIVDGESEPVIGRLFKCLSIGPNVGGQGTCYDVEYNDNTASVVSGTVSLAPATDPSLTVGKVRITDAYGDPILTTAGNLMVGISNIYTANPLHTILDSGTVSLSASLTTAEYNSGAISAGGFTGTSFDLGQNSLFDCLLYATGVITTGNVRLDYSIDNINWIPNNTSTALAPLSSTDPHFVYLGIKSGSRYVRVSSGVGSTFRATTNLQMIFSSKRD